MKRVTMAIAVGCIIGSMWWVGWRAERWFNWKFSYGVQVEQRIEEIEKRVDKLELNAD